MLKPSTSPGSCPFLVLISKSPTFQKHSFNPINLFGHQFRRVVFALRVLTLKTSPESARCLFTLVQQHFWFTQMEAFIYFFVHPAPPVPALQRSANVWRKVDEKIKQNLFTH
uniref:(northern house mosquito) hypothetical protein n=1 Tax=Culex pipiens TaxID=7175 RepID=A0A8D8EZ15_CULPI